MNKNIFRVGFVVASVILLGLLAPFIWVAVQAGVGLVAIAGMAALGLGVIQMLPFIGQKLENTVLKLRKSEARTNPIEQLQNFLRQKAQQVADFKVAVTSIGAQIKTLQSMVDQRKRERPGYDASAQEKSIKAMSDVFNMQVQKYKNAEQALDELKLAIQDKEFEWKFSQAGQKAQAALSATSGKELMEAMLADEAFSAVTENFNTVFAELEMEAQHLTETKQLEFDQGMTIDLSTINLSQKVPA